MADYTPPNTDQLVRATLGALLSLEDLAGIGFDANGLVEFAGITIKAAAKALSLELTPTQIERLQDENTVFVANSGLLGGGEDS